MAKPAKDRPLKHAIDISNYWTNGRIVSDAEAMDLLKAVDAEHPFDKVICGTQVPSVCIQQATAAHKLGKGIELYHMLPWTPLLSRVEREISDLTYIRSWVPWAEFLWLDAEGNTDWSPDYLKEQIAHYIREARHEFKDNVGIYTVGSWWREHMLGWQSIFRSRSLWVADWNGLADRLEPTEPLVRWGGWMADDLRMRQYAGNVEIAGLKVDLNVYV